MALPEKDAQQLASEKVKAQFLAGDFTPTLTLGKATPRHVSMVMCLWNRPGRMAEILDMLAGQRWTRGIDLYLWNNNADDHEVYETAIREHGLTGALRSIQLINSPINLGSIARFYVARKLADENLAGPVIILDDDEVVTPWFVRKAIFRYDPKALTAWWAFRVDGAYWDKIPVKRGERVDHIGPGGMICDSRIFLDDAFFTDIPEKYWLLDDLWLTYYARSKSIPLKKLDVTIEFVLKEKNQWYSVADLKEEFFTYLYGNQ